MSEAVEERAIAEPFGSAGRPVRRAVSLTVGTDGSAIRVEGARITIVGEMLSERTGPHSPPAGVELGQVVWLTSAESALLESPPLDAASGLGAILLPLLQHAAQSPPGSPLDRLHLAIMIRGLLSAAAAERCGATVGGDPLPALVVQAMQIIHSRLATPSLTNAGVAGRLGVSVRTLQIAFRASRVSPARVIRALRLERALLEVQSEPAPSPSFLAAVAGRWGFSGRSSLLRALRREYGILHVSVGYAER